ncbi:argininosuccinate lyase [Brucepastera parasyntrophica]|uniref:argininosuccinate lyase n=1 Tax=Brucepastera parasyntrophica TaxID=2880008 RepID=UPI00210E63E9|nr:argininosuccinate lyase [Brucepastera parasyntrophica]ULQ59684.1 argininosuccinate lyase [Brucepastera parasyntrophica]
MSDESSILKGERAALWHGRFSEGPDAEAVEFETSIYADSRMALDDITGSIAHAEMLGRQHIIPEEDASKISAALKDIAYELESGKLSIDPKAEDIHSFIEGVLTERLGDTGKKIHTGRSRNDQIALDERLYLRKAIPDLQDSLITLIETLSEIAEKHTHTLMSGYTHLQRAQPVTLAHHLCAWCWMLVRDWNRFEDALARLDYMPLGSGALAGSGLPLDRNSVAEELGFSHLTQNSLDAVSDRDYCLEIAAHISILMTHLSRFCEEIVLWSTEEFKFIELSEKWSTGSSIMPQKKNPDFAELIRGKTGRVYGDLIALLTMVKGLPLSYNRDLQEDKDNLFDAYDTVFSCVRIFTHMIASAKWNDARMKESCGGGYANATDLADYLVRKGLPFRTAHEVAAGIVRECIQSGVSDIVKLPLENLLKHSALIGPDIYEKLSPEACVQARDLPGGPNPARVGEQISQLRGFIKKAR